MNSEQQQQTSNRATIYIQKDQGIILKQWNKPLLQNGISHHSFQLPNTSETGWYNILVQYQGKNSTATFSIKDKDLEFGNPINSSVTIEGPNNISPGLPYTGLVRVQTLYNTPLKGESVTIMTPYFSKAYISDKDGLIKFSLPSTNNDFFIKALNGNQPYPIASAVTLERAYSPSGSYLQILPLTTPVVCPSSQIFTIMHTSNLTFSTQLFFKLVSGDFVDSGSIMVELQANASSVSEEIQRWDATSESTESEKNEEKSLNPFPAAKSKGVIKIKINIGNKMSSSAYLHVHYVASNDEIVSDSLKFKIHACHKASVNFSSEEVSIGEKTGIAVFAKPLSTCSIGVVDKSVFVHDSSHSMMVFPLTGDADISDGNGIFKMFLRSSHLPFCDEHTKSDYDKINRGGSYHWAGKNYVGMSQEFKFMGYQFASNMRIHTSPCVRGRCSRWNKYGEAICSQRGFDDGSESCPCYCNGNCHYVCGSCLTSRIQTLTYIPFTWHWDLIATESDGRYITSKHAPSKETQLVATAICFNPKDGFQVIPPKILKINRSQSKN